MKKFDWLIIIILIVFYLTLLYVLKKEFFSYQFPYETLKNYLCSQDIPYEPPCKRIFLSDDQIHQAAGYLYLLGEDPSRYNFQHPPLVKYFYGLLIHYFKNPYFGQIVLAVWLIFFVYYIGKKIFNSLLVSTLSAFLLILDNLFLSLSTSTLLDLPQTLFNLLYFSSIFIWKKYLLAGIFLAMFAGSKFYGAAIFFALIYFLFLYLKGELKIKNFLFHLLIAFILFNLFYLNSYLKQGWRFNIFFFQLKIIKFWLNHSITNFPFASVPLFLMGIYKEWRAEYKLSFSHIYSLFWPVSLIANLYLLKNSLNFARKEKRYWQNNYLLKKILAKWNLFKKELDLKFLIYIISPLYLIFLGAQAPFVRYFMIILPFSYLGLAKFFEQKIIKKP